MLFMFSLVLATSNKKLRTGLLASRLERSKRTLLLSSPAAWVAAQAVGQRCWEAACGGRGGTRSRRRRTSDGRSFGHSTVIPCR